MPARCRAAPLLLRCRRASCCGAATNDAAQLLSWPPPLRCHCCAAAALPAATATATATAAGELPLLPLPPPPQCCLRASCPGAAADDAALPPSWPPLLPLHCHYRNCRYRHCCLAASELSLLPLPLPPPCCCRTSCRSAAADDAALLPSLPPTAASLVRWGRISMPAGAEVAAMLAAGAVGFFDSGDGDHIALERWRERSRRWSRGRRAMLSGCQQSRKMRSKSPSAAAAPQ